MSATTASAEAKTFDLKGFISKFAIVLILALFVVILAVITGGRFLRHQNLINVVVQVAPIGIIAEMANIGTLSAFLIAAIGVLVLRITKPELPRTFRCPAVWIIAPLAVIACGYLMYNLPLDTWIRFVVWCAAGCAVYFSYSYQHSSLGRQQAAASADEADPQTDID